MIVSMKKVKLFFLENDKDQLLNELQFNALFMPDKKHYQPQNPSKSLLEVGKAIEVIERHLKKSTGNHAIVDKDTFEVQNPKYMELTQRILNEQQTFYTLEERLKSLQQVYKDLLPYKNLSVSQSRLETLRFTTVTLGYYLKTNEEAFVGHMDTLGAFSETLSSDDDYNYVAILVDKEQNEQLLSILDSMDFKFAKKMSSEKTNEELISEFNKEMTELQAQMDRITTYFESSANELGALKLLYDQLLSEETRLQISFLSTDTTLYIEGWVRSDQVDQLSDVLNKKDIAFELEARDPLPDEPVPTAMKNNRFVKPFEYITNQFSTPSAYEVDPNPSMSIWYWLIFGIMMGDVGYGIVMVLLFGAALKFGKFKGAMKDLINVFFYTGFSAIGAGLVFGSMFGATLYTPLLEPINDPIPMLIISLIIGVIHVMHGLIIKLINSYRQKDIAGGLNDAGSWLFILMGLSLLISAMFLPMDALVKNILMYTSYGFMGLGVLLIVVLNGRDQKSIVGKMVSAFTGLYNSTGYLSDILSYSRILALALSSAVIAYTMNLLADMVWHSMPVIGILFGILVYIVGHVFNFIMGMLSAYVHAGRLQYLEFYGKFFEGGGYLFEPLQLQLKYVYQVNLKENNNKKNKEIL